MGTSWAGSAEADHFILSAQCLSARLRALISGCAYSLFSIGSVGIRRALFAGNSVIRHAVFCLSATRAVARALQNIGAPLCVKHRVPKRAFFLKTV